MRPKSEKNKARDWYRNRRWRQIDWSIDDWKSQHPKGIEIRSMLSYYPKKETRINANQAVRRYKDYIPNGCAYKKIYDVEYEVW